MPAAKNCADVGTKPVSASATATLQVYGIGILLTIDPTLHYKMMAGELVIDLVKNTEIRGGRSRTQEPTVVNVDREHRDGCAS